MWCRAAHHSLSGPYSTACGVCRLYPNDVSREWYTELISLAAFLGVDAVMGRQYDAIGIQC